MLIIDSHKGVPHAGVTSLHVRNARILARELGATLVTTEPRSDELAAGMWDVIVFNHASPYAAVDYAHVERNPEARLLYITNEWNLGEPRILWLACKAGRTYEVIANHPPAASKVVKKYVSAWHTVNLNAIIYDDALVRPMPDGELFGRVPRVGYWGAFRKDRIPSFQRYFDDRLLVSTSQKNREKFEEAGLTPQWMSRLQWDGREPNVTAFLASLYIEDEKSHTHYNHLANRFYEALSWGVPTYFDAACRNTLALSGLPDAASWIVTDADDLHARSAPPIPPSWYEHAYEERRAALAEIRRLVRTP